MASAYDDALGTLYRAPLAAFVAERKRLGAELKAAGDAAGAVRLAKLARPTISAWAVNQLFWRERRAFDELLEAAARLRDGEVDAVATGAYRAAVATLRAHAAALLAAAGKSPSEATLHRVTVTLSALAAAGGFDPDPPGALTGDRDPLGFDVPGLKPAAPAKRTHAAPVIEAAEDERRQKADAAEEQRRVERERAQKKAERAQKKAEREQTERRLRGARSELEERTDEVARLEKSLAAAADTVERLRATVRELETRLAELGTDVNDS